MYPDHEKPHRCGARVRERVGVAAPRQADVSRTYRLGPPVDHHRPASFQNDVELFVLRVKVLSDPGPRWKQIIVDEHTAAGRMPGFAEVICTAEDPGPAVALRNVECPGLSPSENHREDPKK